MPTILPLDAFVQKFLVEEEADETDDDEEMELEFEQEPRSLEEVTQKLLASDIELQLDQNSTAANSIDSAEDMELQYEETKHPLIHAFYQAQERLWDCTTSNLDAIK